MPDNKHRLFDFHFTEFWKKDVIQKKRCDGKCGMDHEKQDHAHKKHKVPAESK
jgi:hypothetical protein